MIWVWPWWSSASASVRSSLVSTSRIVSPLRGPAQNPKASASANRYGERRAPRQADTLPALDRRHLAVVTNADGKGGNPMGGVSWLPISEGTSGRDHHHLRRAALDRLGRAGFGTGTEGNSVATVAPGRMLGSLAWWRATPLTLFAFALTGASTRRGGSHATNRGPPRPSFTLNLAATPIWASGVGIRSGVPHDQHGGRVIAEAEEPTCGIDKRLAGRPGNNCPPSSRRAQNRPRWSTGSMMIKIAGSRVPRAAHTIDGAIHYPQLTLHQIARGPRIRPFPCMPHANAEATL